MELRRLQRKKRPARRLSLTGKKQPTERRTTWQQLAFDIALYDAAKKNNVDKAKRLLKKRADVRAGHLSVAISNGHTAMVRFLIGKGADVNERDADGWPSLITAAVTGHYDICKIVLENKADVNATDRRGINALRFTDNAGICRLLLDNGANRVTEAYENAVENGYVVIISVIRKWQDEKLKAVFGSMEIAMEFEKYVFDCGKIA